MQPPAGEATLNDFPIAAVRAQFPALGDPANERSTIHLDGPGGTQVCRSAIDGIARFMKQEVANVGGRFESSIGTERVLHDARLAAADLLGARADEVAFGPNMTSLTFALLRALARGWTGGDESVLTRLDHDANVAPWLEVAAERGMVVRWLDFDPLTGELELDQLPALLGPRTRLVALTAASNALGTLVPVKAATALVRNACKAMVFVDAVQSVPHVETDVTDIGCDFLVWSAYKFFGPHLGRALGRPMRPGRRARLQGSPSKRCGGPALRDRDLRLRGRRGLTGALDYVEGIGRVVDPAAPTRRARILAAMSASRCYEERLGGRLLAGLRDVPDLRLWVPKGQVRAFRPLPSRSRIASLTRSFAISPGDA